MIISIIKSLRPNQWTKNLILFAALIFSENLLDVSMVLNVLLGFFLFSFASGGIYIINDIIDFNNDKNHPVKSIRPIAAGKLDRKKALIISLFIIFACLFGSFFLKKDFSYVLIAYIILQIFYSFILKNIIILDVFTIAAGFVLRAIAGAEIINVPISSWLLICTMLLALFLVLGKRRREIVLVQKSSAFRKVLTDYSPQLLDQMVSVVTSSTVIAYTLYTLSGETVKKFNTKNLVFTIPFVLYGILRYLYLIYKMDKGESPEKILINDRPLQINILLYLALVLAIIYI